MTCAQPHVVVTGASSGIGRATVMRLAASGWHVFAGVRQPEHGESLRATVASGSQITPLLMDVTDVAQIKAGAESVADHVGATGLNALVDNAGVGVTSPMELVALDTLRNLFEVNVVGQIAVTQAFVPMLRQARGRIVVIGSIGGRMTPPFGAPLAASKSAIASMADGFRQELAPWGVRVVLLEPGSIRTEAVDKVRRDAVAVSSAFSPEEAELYREAYLGMIDVAVAREAKGSPPSVVGDLVANVLMKPRPRSRYVVGKDARLLANLTRFTPTLMFDAMRRKIFYLPAFGSRAATVVGEGVSR
jgi:NAD(P)-dependent dehydrogenase (short-subunit alcohol dehydrogenase family)